MRTRDTDDLGELSRRLGVKVEGGLLETALTHASYAHENPDACPDGDNQRLEFLGDAVLQFCTAQLLYRRFRKSGAGELTRLRAAAVSEEALWRVAEGLELGRYLRLGRGEEASGGRGRRSLLADALEAVVGAVYLSAGIREAQRFVRRHLGPTLERAATRPALDPKTALQECAQAAGLAVSYRLVRTSGPDHLRVFEVECLVDGTPCGVGSGRTKKEAEQAAALRALEALRPSSPAGAADSPSGRGGCDGRRPRRRWAQPCRARGTG
ncbi:MAG: ribonuclease III [Firmicutes bacterium]|nr:ribonuclease III [Bacillota bacterium]